MGWTQKPALHPILPPLCRHHRQRMFRVTGGQVPDIFPRFVGLEPFTVVEQCDSFVEDAGFFAVCHGACRRRMGAAGRLTLGSATGSVFVLGLAV